jgi:hypothetical protein
MTKPEPSLLVDQVMRLWIIGDDTAKIGRLLGCGEPLAERALHIGLEARRAARISSQGEGGGVREGG